MSEALAPLNPDERLIDPKTKMDLTEMGPKDDEALSAAINELNMPALQVTLPKIKAAKSFGKILHEKVKVNPILLTKGFVSMAHMEKATEFLSSIVNDTAKGDDVRIAATRCLADALSKHRYMLQVVLRLAKEMDIEVVKTVPKAAKNRPPNMLIHADNLHVHEQAPATNGDAKQISDSAR
jgi:hypothetical protein